MKCVLSFLAGLAIVSTNAWAGGVGINLKLKKDGNLRFAVVGDFREANGDCLAKTFSIGVYDTQSGESNWYVSKAGKSEWNVNSQKCNTNQEISHDLLQYGKVIEVRAYDSYGRTLDRYFANIPCEEKMAITQDGLDILMGTATTTSALVCGNAKSDAVVVKDRTEETIVLPTPPPPPTLQSCALSASVNKFDSSIVEVKASCNISGVAYLRMNINGRSVISRYVDVFDRTSMIAVVARNPYKSMAYEILLTDQYGKTLSSVSNTILSDPTFDSMVTGSYQTSASQLATVEKDSFGEGLSYSAVISLKVEDLDLKDARREIRVELIDSQTGKIVYDGIRNVTSGETVVFGVHGRFEDNFFGNYWDLNYTLKPGKNSFFVRVYDAFHPNNYVDLKTVTVMVL